MRVRIPPDSPIIEDVMNRFVISDTHFGHANILNFLSSDGTKVRDFSTVEEMDETMIENWNKTVSIKDTIYHLGDVAMRKEYLKVLSRLNGRKILIKGNHDIFELKYYLPYFEDIRSYVVKDKYIFSHIPIHSDSADRFVRNVHGHTHKNVIEDERYVNVCVEHTNYTPLSFDEVFKR